MMNRTLILPAIVMVLAAVPAGVHAQTETDAIREIDRFVSVFERVRAQYVRPVTDEQLIEGAIQGMLSSLDPHSSYLGREDMAAMMEQTDGEYAGLGVTVTIDDGAVKVVSVMDENGAARAGIRPGDYITHIDGDLMYDLTLDEAVEKMKGAPGTVARLTVLRQGSALPLRIDVTRSQVQTRSVRFEPRGNVGYIRIATFLNGHTAEQTAEAIESLQRRIGENLTGYVVDLRSNGGGLVDEAVKVADLFLERGEIVSERGRDARDLQRFYASSGDLTGAKPVIVLIDSGTASASEIVAGALQDHGRALLMGERSFGKGLVQTLIPMSSEAALRLSTALYYTPSGTSVQERGIAPDIEVPQLSDPNRALRPAVREADIRRHLLNLSEPTDERLTEDVAADPRFAITPDEIARSGIHDYQLDYALRTLERLAPLARS